VSNKLREIERLLRAAMADELRANNLLGMGGVDFSPAQRRELREVASMAGENVITYADISRFCYKDMDESCLRYARERQGDPLAGTEAERRGDVYVYDPAALEPELSAPAAAPPPAAPVPAGPCPPSAEGQPCDDGLFCTEQSVCRAGVCTGTLARACGALSSCDEAQNSCRCTACQEADGTCSLGRIWYRDADGDGFGDLNASVVACSQPAGFIAGSPTDCCDKDANARPGQSGFFKAVNACSSWDYDCSGTTAYQLGCSGKDSCGCISSGTCNVGSCGTQQTIASCSNSGPYGQTVCFGQRSEALGCH